MASRFIGGDEGIRTLDPLLAGQVLSQLSYTPISTGSQPNGHPKLNNRLRLAFVVIFVSLD